MDAGSRLLAEAFKYDPPIRYLLSALSPEKRETYREHFFRSLLKAVTLNGGSISEIGDWQSCGIVMPPGSKLVASHFSFLGDVWTIARTIGLTGLRVRRVPFWKLPS